MPYIDDTGIAADAKGPLFCTVGRDGKLTGNALHRVNAYEMVGRLRLLRPVVSIGCRDRHAPYAGDAPTAPA